MRAVTPKEYPAVITERILTDSAHVPDAEIEQDIAETQMEVVVRLKLNTDIEGRIEREMFIAFLRRLLSARRKEGP